MPDLGKGKLYVEWSRPESVTFTCQNAAGDHVAIAISLADAQMIARQILGFRDLLTPGDVALMRAEPMGHA